MPLPSLPFSSPNSNNLLHHLGHDDPTINGIHQFDFENPNTNFGLNHINELGQGFLKSTQPLTAGNNNINFFNNQTGTINSTLGLGGGRVNQLQLGVSQRLMMNSSDPDQVMRRANLVAPQQSQRVQVHTHTVIDYFPAVFQNRSLGPNHEVTFTEIVRSQLLTATSTRERILQVSNIEASAFACRNNNNNNNLDLNQYSYTDQRPSQPQGVHGNIGSHDDYNYHNNLAREHGYNFHHNIFSHNQYPNPPVAPRSRATLRLIENTAEPTSGVKAKRSSCSIISSSSSSNVPAVAVGHEDDHQIQDRDKYYSSDHDDQYEEMMMMEVGDGRTHSLPCKKYGPYTCPRCMGVFNTSQSFAAHMGSHYKHETASERKRRKEAKYGKKSLRLVNSREGLTLLPTTHHDHNKNTRKLAKRLHLLDVKADPDHDQDDDHNQLLAAPPTSPPGFNFEEGLVEVQVKEEPLDML